MLLKIFRLNIFNETLIPKDIYAYVCKTKIKSIKYKLCNFLENNLKVLINFLNIISWITQK